MMRLCRQYLPMVFVLIAGTTAAACAQQPAALAPAGSVADQLARGEAIYARDCATAQCHGVQGEGIRSGSGFSAWPLVGPEFTQRNPTAQVIFDVARFGQQTIEPGRGVSGHAVFVLPAGAVPASLRYASASVSLTDGQTP